MKIDVRSQSRSLRQRLDTETNPVLRHNIATVIRHIEGELADNVDLTMSTMVAEPVIRSFHGSLAGRFVPKPIAERPANEKYDRYMAVEGAASVRAMYDAVCGERLVWAQLDVDLLAVDTHCIIQGGLFHCPAPGSALKELGIEVDDEDGHYLTIGRLIVVFPFDVESGLLLGEDIYADPLGSEGAERRKIGPDDYYPRYETTVDLPPR